MQDWIIFLLGLLLAIPLSILANFATPWAKSTYERSVFSSKKKKIERLLQDYQTTKIYKDNPLRYVVKLISDVMTLLFLLFTFVVLTGIVIINVQRGIPTPDIASDLGYSLLLFLLIIIFFMTNWRVEAIKEKSSDIFDFEEYEKEVIEQLTILGATTEDII